MDGLLPNVYQTLKWLWYILPNIISTDYPFCTVVSLQSDPLKFDRITEAKYNTDDLAGIHIPTFQNTVENTPWKVCMSLGPMQVLNKIAYLFWLMPNRISPPNAACCLYPANFQVYVLSCMDLDSALLHMNSSMAWVTGAGHIMHPKRRHLLWYPVRSPSWSPFT